MTTTNTNYNSPSLVVEVRNECPTAYQVYLVVCDTDPKETVLRVFGGASRGYNPLADAYAYANEVAETLRSYGCTVR